MKKFLATASIAVLLSFSATQGAQAQLGGLLGLDTDDGLEINLLDDTAKVRLGGGDNDVLDVKVLDDGDGGSLANANVNAGRDSILGVDAGLLDDTVTANVDVGGDDILDVDVGIGNGGNGGNGGVNGGGNGGVNGGGINGGNRFASSDPNCAGVDPSTLIQMFEQSTLSGWDNASNIQIQALRVCPDIRSYVANYFASSGKYQQMQMLLRSDPLVAASLSRSSYDANRVFGVTRQSSSLTVFVF